MDILILFSLIGIGAIIWVAFSKPPEIDPAPRFKPKKYTAQLAVAEKLYFEVQLQHVGDQVYWYCAHTKAFIAQGKNLEEIIKVLKIRYPYHIFLLPMDRAICCYSGWQMVYLDKSKNRVYNNPTI